jgi:formylglycine-generating enzyme required for sulfatase activity
VNPRRVKNVINDLNLQWFMAVNSGQADGVNRDDFICWQALMRAASSAFTRQVLDFEDKERRHSFILDALKWQNGKQEDKDAVKGYFNAYEDKDSKRLRGVLKQISFSDGFTSDVLEALIYMVAPPTVVSNIGGIAYGTSVGLGNLTELQADTEKMPVEETKKSEISDVARIVVEEKAYVLPRDVMGNIADDKNRITIGGLDFMRVPAGKFVMGSRDDNELATDSEKPQHTIDIRYDYWMAKFALTNDQYAEHLGKDIHPVPDWYKRKDHPVVNVSWYDGIEYCKWFNDTHRTELGDLFLRLPTEAEWEKAARGAYGNEWPWGNEFDPNKCNTAEGRKGITTPVGMYSALGGDSPYGCADMVGNAWEWCNDWFSDSEYKSRISMSAVNPYGPQNGEYRVLHGGSFISASNDARCGFRNFNFPDRQDFLIGFRVCISPRHISEI